MKQDQNFLDNHYDQLFPHLPSWFFFIAINTTSVNETEKTDGARC